MLFAAALPPVQKRGDLLVSLSGEHRIVVIDSASGTEAASFPAALGPHEIALSGNRRFAYVANSGSGPGGKPGDTITVIDLQSHQVRQLKTDPHRQPHDVRVSRDGKLIWIAVAPSKAVLEMDATTGEIKRAFATERDGGWFVVVTPDNARLYVPLLEGRALTVIDRASTVVRVLISGGAFSGAEVSPDGRELWAIEHEQRQIHIVSTATDTVTAKVPLASDGFGRLQFTPDGRRVLVVQGSRVFAFDADTRRPAGVVELPGAGKVLAVTPDGLRAAVSHPSENNVSIIDLCAMRVRETVAVGATPDGMAWVR